jgi:hypothetical protein
MDLLEKIDNALNLFENEQQKEGAYLYLTDIISILKQMRDIISNNRICEGKMRKRISAGLGKLVMEEYSFSESEFGTILLKIADEFAKSDSR